MAMPIEAILFGLLLVTALVIVRLRNLFAVVMIAGFYSLVSAALFTVLDALQQASGVFIGFLGMNKAGQNG